MREWRSAVLVLVCVVWLSPGALAREPLGLSAGLDADGGPDVNADGIDDLVIGVPSEDSLVGALTVALSTKDGPDARQSSLWSQESPGVEGVGGGYFGDEHASGDFDGDGFDDLAIGVRYGASGQHEESGEVNVLYGSAAGLTADGDQLWSQGSPGIPGEPETQDQFGAQVETGDFDADGYADLVVALVHDTRRFVPAIHVIYGSPDGLVADGDQYWRWPDRGAGGRGQDAVTALAVSDLDGDGHDDLAWGVPDADGARGGIHFLAGNPEGLELVPGPALSQATDGVAGDPHPGEGFAHAMVAGDFDGDGDPDLAVSIPSDLDTGRPARAVQVFAGSPDGLTTGSEQFDEKDLGVAHKGDNPRFLSLAAGDFDADGSVDLAVGLPFGNAEAARVIKRAGVVAVIPGTPSGLDPDAAERWHQNHPGIPGKSRPYDRFGASTSVADLDGDGHADLAVGVPGEDVLGISGSGAAHVIYGSVDGLVAADSEFWSEATRFVEGDPEHSDGFGAM